MSPGRKTAVADFGWLRLRGLVGVVAVGPLPAEHPAMWPRLEMRLTRNTD